MGEIIRTMLDLIAYEVCGKEIDRLRYILTDEEFAKLYKLSKSHGLAHLVGDALIKTASSETLLKNPQTAQPPIPSGRRLCVFLCICVHSSPILLDNSVTAYTNRRTGVNSEPASRFEQFFVKAPPRSRVKSKRNRPRAVPFLMYVSFRQILSPRPERTGSAHPHPRGKSVKSEPEWFRPAARGR